VKAKNGSTEVEHDVRDPTEMARILCVSELELRRLTTAGVLQRTLRKRHGRQRVVYVWETNVIRYIGHLSQPAQHAREDYQNEKKLTQAIVRQQKELELAIARGDMIRRARVVFIMTNTLGSIKNHMLGLPARCARRVYRQRDLAKVRAILDEDVRKSLTEASQFGVHSFDETSKNGHRSQAKSAVARRVERRRRRG